MLVMNRLCLIALCLLSAVFPSLAQNLNDVYSLSIAPLNYVEPSKSTTVGSVLGTLAEAASGQTSNNRHPEVVPYIEAVVKTAFSDVRRLAPVDGEGQFSLIGEVVNVTTWTKSRTTESKDSKGKVVKTVHTDYYASSLPRLHCSTMPPDKHGRKNLLEAVALTTSSLKPLQLRQPSTSCRARL